MPFLQLVSNVHKEQCCIVRDKSRARQRVIHQSPDGSNHRTLSKYRTEIPVIPTSIHLRRRAVIQAHAADARVNLFTWYPYYPCMQLSCEYNYVANSNGVHVSMVHLLFGIHSVCNCSHNYTEVHTGIHRPNTITLTFAVHAFAVLFR